MKNIIYVSSVHWGYFHHRQQEMMLWFSENGYRVFFWEPNNTASKSLEVDEVKENLFRVQNWGLRFERCSILINAINAALQKIAFERLRKQKDINNTLIWFDRVHGIDTAYYLGRYRCIYDLVDELTAFGRWNNSKMLVSIERNVLGSCDLLVSSSSVLLERKGCYSTADALLVPNGLYLSDYRFCPQKTHGRTVGFIGTLSGRSIDFGMLARIADRLPDYTFVLVGPKSSCFSKYFVARKNIIIKDGVESARVSQVLSDFDVGIIPYRSDDATMNYVFPKKICEYLAVGLPVVATPLKEVKVFGNAVTIAKDDRAIAQAIVEVIATDSAAARQARRDVAAAYDWDILLSGLEKNVDRLFPATVKELENKC